MYFSIEPVFWRLRVKGLKVICNGNFTYVFYSINMFVLSCIAHKTTLIIILLLIIEILSRKVVETSLPINALQNRDVRSRTGMVMVPAMVVDNTWRATMSDREVNISLKHCYYNCFEVL